MASQPSLQQPLAVVRPTPLHPLDEIPLDLHPSGSTIGSAQAPPRQPSPSSHLASLYSSCNLPTKGNADDAQEALAKLDRLAKQREKRIKWRRQTERITSPLGRGGKKDADGYASDSSSSDSIDLSKAFEEVKLKITSLPGHPVVGRMRNAASRARDRIGRGDGDSPVTSPNAEDDGVAYRFPLTRSIGAAARRFSMNKTPPPLAEYWRRGSTASPDIAASTPPAGKDATPADALADPGRMRTLASQNPELLVVDEEGHEQQAEEQQNGGLRRPAFLMENSDQSPASRSTGSSPDSTPCAEPSANPVVFNLMPNGNSAPFVFHDEPQEHDLSGRPLHDRTLSPSASPSSASGLTDSDEAEGRNGSALQSDSSDDEGEGLTDRDAELLRCGSVSLKHAEAFSKEDLKRQRRLIRREVRRQKRKAARGEVSHDGQPVPSTSKTSQLSHGVGQRVTKGLHYASSQSRNRRAMERYSPNPAKQLHISTTDLNRSGTSSVHGTPSERGGSTPGPFAAISPVVSRASGYGIVGGRRGSLANSRRSSFAEHDAEAPAAANVDEYEGGSALGRHNTHMSIASSRGSFRKYLRAPHVLRKRRHSKWEAELAALEAAGSIEGTPTAQADPEKELDHMLGKLAAEQAPSDAGKGKFEFDVLYENQRGLLVFGIPKFSPRTLFQWDPSPWTTVDNKKSPYNIANAQLPDPSWDWIYPEWLIDMTGDTDEAGWQYSGNFGRRFWPNVHFPHGKLGLPKTGVEGIKEMNARQAEKQAKRVEKEREREDGGLEALKRSARIKSDKWQGTPDPWTFVRRRRWIRLRRRRPLATAEAASQIAKEARDASPNQEALTVTGPSGTKTDKDSFLESGSSLSGSDEEDTDEESGTDSDGTDHYDLRDYAPPGAGPSAFLPRKLPGDLVNGPNPMRFKKGGTKARRAHRHAKEFTGTLRELKSLLPSIMAGEREDRPTRSNTDANGGVPKAAMLKLNNVDARNPFISWKFVKSRLDDSDMAFASATLRARDKRYLQRRNVVMQRRHQGDGSSPTSVADRAIPSRFLKNDSPQAISNASASGSAQPTRSTDANAAATSADGFNDTTASSSANSQGIKELTREALIEINYGRAMRVLKACKVDRQRMDLWRLWLGIESLESLLEHGRAPLIDPRDTLEAALHSPSPPPTHVASSSGQHLNLSSIYFSGGASSRYRQRAERQKARWRSAVSLPDVADVWDLLERKLDDLLLLFEYQSSRTTLLRTLLAIHSYSHAEHVYRDRSIRSNPSELSPTHVHGLPAEMGGGQPIYPRDGWQKSGLPRLEFFSDVQALLGAVTGSSAPAGGEAEMDADSLPLRIGQLADASTSSLNMPFGAAGATGEVEGPNIRRPRSAASSLRASNIGGPLRAQSASPSPSPSSLSQWASSNGLSASTGTVRRSSTTGMPAGHMPQSLVMSPFAPSGPPSSSDGWTGTTRSGWAEQHQHQHLHLYQHQAQLAVPNAGRRSSEARTVSPLANQVVPPRRTTSAVPSHGAEPALSPASPPDADEQQTHEPSHVSRPKSVPPRI